MNNTHSAEKEASLDNQLTGKNRAQPDEDGFVTAWEPCWFTGVRWVCVAVKISDDKVEVRDTKDPQKNTLTFSRDEWARFVAGVKDGQFDV